MYDHIQGEYVAIKPTSLVIRAFGVGYLLRISLNTYSVIKDWPSGIVYTYLQVSENSHTLFGFHNFGEREVFMALISVTGVGPSTALNILSHMDWNDVEYAATHGNADAFQKVKGVGAKTAAQIVLDLKGKFNSETEPLVNMAKEAFSKDSLVFEEAVSGLMNMGYNKTDSRKMTQKAVDSGETTLDGIIRYALKNG